MFILSDALNKRKGKHFIYFPYILTKQCFKRFNCWNRHIKVSVLVRTWRIRQSEDDRRRRRRDQWTVEIGFQIRVSDGNFREVKQRRLQIVKWFRWEREQFLVLFSGGEEVWVSVSDKESHFRRRKPKVGDF